MRQETKLRRDGEWIDVCETASRRIETGAAGLAGEKSGRVGRGKRGNDVCLCGYPC